ncbi:hypothetical protein HYFRA_00003593 [Hymenoscyphus fraxineus]|uniref:Uncharacterized protein n=1 Tax=Hymenoscyphus fraxineus TaxID=746836 RepID=A0A9N9PV21_9HELO|nr:hypothetical protein HYFRA_00003593 [Hymenoscyphus fraxineus]
MPPKRARKEKGKGPENPKTATGDKFDNAFAQDFQADYNKTSAGNLDSRIDAARVKMGLLDVDAQDYDEGEILRELHEKNAERVETIVKYQSGTTLVREMMNELVELSKRSEESTQELRERLRRGIASVYPELLGKMEGVEMFIRGELVRLQVENQTLRKSLNESTGQGILVDQIMQSISEKSVQQHQSQEKILAEVEVQKILDKLSNQQSLWKRIDEEKNERLREYERLLTETREKSGSLAVEKAGLEQALNDAKRQIKEVKEDSEAMNKNLERLNSQFNELQMEKLTLESKSQLQTMTTNEEWLTSLREKDMAISKVEVQRNNLEMDAERKQRDWERTAKYANQVAEELHSSKMELRVMNNKLEDHFLSRISLEKRLTSAETELVAANEEKSLLKSSLEEQKGLNTILQTEIERLGRGDDDITMQMYKAQEERHNSTIENLKSSHKRDLSALGKSLAKVDKEREAALLQARSNKLLLDSLTQVHESSKEREERLYELMQNSNTYNNSQLEKLASDLEKQMGITRKVVNDKKNLQAALENAINERNQRPDISVEAWNLEQTRLMKVEEEHKKCYSAEEQRLHYDVYYDTTTIGALVKPNLDTPLETITGNLEILQGRYDELKGEYDTVKRDKRQLEHELLKHVRCDRKVEAVYYDLKVQENQSLQKLLEFEREKYNTIQSQHIDCRNRISRDEYDLLKENKNALQAHLQSLNELRVDYDGLKSTHDKCIANEVKSKEEFNILKGRYEELVRVSSQPQPAPSLPQYPIVPYNHNMPGIMAPPFYTTVGNSQQSQPLDARAPDLVPSVLSSVASSRPSTSSVTPARSSAPAISSAPSYIFLAHRQAGTPDVFESAVEGSLKLCLDDILKRAKEDLLAITRGDNKNLFQRSQVVGPQYIMCTILSNLHAGIGHPDLTKIYREQVEALVFLPTLPTGPYLLCFVSKLTYGKSLESIRHPRRRLIRSYLYLQEEILVLEKIMKRQNWNAREFQEVLAPNSYRVTDQRRFTLNVLESKVLHRLQGEKESSRTKLEQLNAEIERLIKQTLTSLEIKDDDHGKAILVFTIVTLVFLPLSFVSSFFGMNTVDIRNQSASQWIFWAVAVPVTAAVMTIALLLGYNLERIRNWFERTMGKVKSH